jgi:hypothetical protein
MRKAKTAAPTKDKSARFPRTAQTLITLYILDEKEEHKNPEPTAMTTARRLMRRKTRHKYRHGSITMENAHNSRRTEGEVEEYPSSPELAVSGAPYSAARQSSASL